MIVGAILTAGFSLFPFLLPSSIDPTSSLTMWDAVSSHKTLGVMTVAACIFVPLILIIHLGRITKCGESSQTSTLKKTLIVCTNQEMWYVVFCMDSRCFDGVFRWSA
jgi:hypothetical protein